MQHHNQSDVLIIGAGISGLMAATKLEESGCSVTVIDKGRNYGGRMATRAFDEVFLTTALNFSPYDNLYLKPMLINGVLPTS